MAPLAPKIDISENTLRNRGKILEILLIDRTTHKNIIWATDSYEKRGKDFAPKKQILREQITGIYGKTIQPRAAKSKEEQRYRTRDKAEVFTPLHIVKEMNTVLNWASTNWPTTEENWINYISEKRLEITCGEAPFIAGRYNPTSNTGKVIEVHNRVGFLDYKLQVIKHFVDNKKDWLKYAEVALKASYGYEWQGDNLLIARENILQTVDDFYKDFCIEKLKLKSKQGLNDEQLEYFAEIISWNIWQMDGIKCVIPMSCKKTQAKPEPINPNQMSWLPPEKPKKVFVECDGCRTGNYAKHTGRYAKIMDWESGRQLRFIDLYTRES